MRLPTEDILAADPPEGPRGTVIGRSREGRDLRGHLLGHGELHVSLIAGCHADEPVGPEMLSLLADFLTELSPDHELVEKATWFIIPHLNPDGASRNAAWVDRPIRCIDSKGRPDLAYDPFLYVEQVARELPGDDIEFGFPRAADDRLARPENQCAASFLAPGAPFRLHASFHGMGFAPGPWFLLEPSWIDRTDQMRERLRETVHQMELPLFDADRKGEKGFSRIDEGFSTRPDSAAMVRFFRDRGDDDTAARFRPSSMEYVRSLGGDPLTVVSEMPLFLLLRRQEESERDWFRPGTEGTREIHARIRELNRSKTAPDASDSLSAAGLGFLAIRDQMRLQIALLDEALQAIVSQEESRGSA